MSAPGKLLVIWIITPDRKRFFIKMLSIWLWCFPSGLCHVHKKLTQANCIGLSRIATGQMLNSFLPIFSADSNATALKLTGKPRDLLLFSKLPKT